MSKLRDCMRVCGIEKLNVTASTILDVLHNISETLTLLQSELPTNKKENYMPKWSETKQYMLDDALSLRDMWDDIAKAVLKEHGVDSHAYKETMEAQQRNARLIRRMKRDKEECNA